MKELAEDFKLLAKKQKTRLPKYALYNAINTIIPTWFNVFAEEFTQYHEFNEKSKTFIPEENQLFFETFKGTKI